MLDDTSGTPLKVGRKGPLEMNLSKESPSWLGLIGAMRCDACACACACALRRSNNMDPTGTWIVRGFTQATVKTSSLSRETECESKVRGAQADMQCTAQYLIMIVSSVSSAPFVPGINAVPGASTIQSLAQSLFCMT